jgi:hypothetical protein
MDSSEEDQRLEHHRQPPHFLDLDELCKATGVEYFKVSATFWKNLGNGFEGLRQHILAIFMLFWNSRII